MPRKRALALVVAVVGMAGGSWGARAAAAPVIAFGAPHTAGSSRASVDRAWMKRLEAAVDAASLGDTDAVRDFALRTTGAALDFGLAHRTTLAFDAGPREGNCIEYAHLFALVFDLAAARKHLAARAYVVHSAEARVLGSKVPLRGFGDHDWALVVAKDAAGQTARFFVDPTLYDAGLGWDIARSVTGRVDVPAP